MTGLTWLRITAALSLLVAVFIAGRLSVATSILPETSATKEHRRLTALPDSSPGTSSNPKNLDRHPADESSHRAQIQTDIESVAATLALASKHLGNTWQLSKIIDAWLAENPDQAISVLASGEQRSEILEFMFASWGEADAYAAQQWLDSNRDLEGYDSAVGGLAAAYVDSKQYEKALELADTTGDLLTGAKIWSNAGFEEFVNNRESALDRLAKTSFPEEFQKRMITTWERRLDIEAKRDAQYLTSVYTSAVAAGATFQGDSPEKIVEELKSGIRGSDSFSTTTFQVPNLSEAKIQHVLEHLQLSDSGTLKLSE